MQGGKAAWGAIFSQIGKANRVLPQSAYFYTAKLPQEAEFVSRRTFDFTGPLDPAVYLRPPRIIDIAAAGDLRIQGL